MKRTAIVFLMIAIGTALWADGASHFLKLTNYRSHLDNAENILEKLFMEEKITLSSDGRQLFIYAWKAVREKKTVLGNSSSSMSYLVISSAREALQKASTDLDTLVYDQKLTFKSQEAKTLYRDALKSIRIALNCI